MQYYRLWIYSCNVVLGLTSVIFIIFAAFVVADVRLSLLDGVELYHPTFFYAYGALILQCGVVQTIGCLGAQRLSHKLLTLYWRLLLVLTLGDIVVGLYWVLHLEKVKINLRPYLSKEFISKYSTDETFTLRWNKIQSQDRCCGVNGPFDFQNFSTSQHHHSAAFAANSHLIVDVETGLLSLPESCCTLIYVPSTVSSSSSGGLSLNKANSFAHHPVEEEHSPFSYQSSESDVISGDDHPSNFAGGGRRGRTVINLPHKNDEPRGEFYDDDDVDGNEVETEFYVDYLDPRLQRNGTHAQKQLVVPDDDHYRSHDGSQPPDQNYQASAVQKRDIKTYEPIHAHKVRHELHRKSQPSSFIDFKLQKNSTLVLGNRFSLKYTNDHNSSVARLDNTTNDHNNIELGQDNISGSESESLLHQSESGVNTNKSVPSILVRIERKRRELRALSVTQVPHPAVKVPVNNCVLCHEQPPGLNRHSSHKKDLVNQKETTRGMNGTRKLQNEKVEASWRYLPTTRTTTSTFTTTPISSAAPAPIQTKFTFSEHLNKVQTNEIEKATKRQGRESLLAKRKSPGIITSSGGSSSPLSSQLTSFSSSQKSSTTGNKEKGRQKRAAQENRDNSDSPFESDTFRIVHGSTFTSEEEAVEKRGDSDSLAEPYFHTVSSSSSSSSFGESSSPHLAVVPPSPSSDYPWHENNENVSSNNGNGSVGSSQKVLYVYGQGCGVKMVEWVDHISGIMFILGFCIIGFVKTCFLVILRTEIREMIEKIHMIEPEEVLSPSRANSKDQRFHVSHPLLQNPHRASTVSAHGVMLPTIKSPDGPSTSTVTPALGGGYNRPNRHYLRRASNFVGGDRSHSNEAMNMSLLMAASQSESRSEGRSNPNLCSGGGSSGTIHADERDPVSGLCIPVPNSGIPSSTTAPRHLRRSSTCSSSANPAGYPFASYGFDGEPRPGPSSRFYQYFEPIYQTPHLYQQHHHHHYTRNRPHARNMSCGAILPLPSYRSNSAAAAATYRGVRNMSNATTTNTASTGCSFSSTHKDENEMLISVSLEHIAMSDQDEEILAEEEDEQQKKDWATATACADNEAQVKSSSKVDDSVGTKLQTFSHSDSATENPASGGGGPSGDRELHRRNGNNNVDLAGSMPMSYLGTAV